VRHRRSLAYVAFVLDVAMILLAGRVVLRGGPPVAAISLAVAVLLAAGTAAMLRRADDADRRTA
jgi:hypothetical protein